MTGPGPDELAAAGKMPMPSMSAEGYESFLVRVLVTRETGNIISGHVTHLNSGQQLRFSKLDAVLVFISRLAATATRARPNDGHWR
jgi:hypothetical protein